MVRLAVAAALVALSSYKAGLVRADDVLNGRVTEVFDFAGEQLTVLKEETLTSNDMFTDYTNEEGEWRTVKDNGKDITQTVWTSGMVCGMFWNQYEATGDTKFKEYAEDCQIGLEGVELLDDNDLGFQVMNSFGLGYRLAGTSSYKERALIGAESLYDNRYQDNIPAFWSWANPTKQPDWDMAVNVDMIMNMEIMLWAAENGGSADYRNAVENHADTTWEDIVRDDYSTFHVADYDPETGELVETGTYQGKAAETTWSRGEAWAVYGHIMLYRYLKEERFLERAKLLLGYFDGNLPDDNVPYADFDAPIDSDNPKDSSATAIVASSLFELFELTGEPVYLEKALEYLSSLMSSTYVDPTASDGWEAVLRKSCAAWGEASTGSVTGDFYLSETMVRYKTMAPSILLQDETEFSATTEGGLATKTFSGADLDNDVDVSGLAEDASVTIWFGVTLSGTALAPVEFLIDGEGVSAPISAVITAPIEGWTEGANIVTFSVASGTLSTIDTVTSVTLVFESQSSSLESSGTTVGVLVDYLIVGQKLKTNGGSSDTPPSPVGVSSDTASPTAVSEFYGSSFDTAAPTSATAAAADDVDGTSYSYNPEPVYPDDEGTSYGSSDSADATTTSDAPPATPAPSAILHEIGTNAVSTEGTSNPSPTPIMTIPTTCGSSTSTSEFSFNEDVGTGGTYYAAGGCFTLTDLYTHQGKAGPLYALDDENNLASYTAGVTGKWLLTSGLHTIEGGTFYCRGSGLEGGDCDELRIESTGPNAFHAISGHGGNLYFESTLLTSWDTDNKEPQTTYEGGRSYINCISEMMVGDNHCTKNDMGECRMDIINSEMGYLGWPDNYSYGISWKVKGLCDDMSILEEIFDDVNVYGDMKGSDIHHNYYGHFSYGHQGGVWTDNKMHDNIKYGFDPHDDSDYLTISKNIVYNNGNHGIIASKRCNNVLIEDNYVYDGGEGAHGIMLHRSCDDSIILNNRVENMQASGIAIMESSRIEISGNTVDGAQYGVRLSCGSSDNRVYENSFEGIEQAGIYVYTGGETPEVGDGRLRDNEFFDNEFAVDYRAVKLMDCDDTLITENTFTGSTKVEFTDAKDTTWSNNSLSSGSCIVDDSTFTGSGPAGCCVLDDSTFTSMGLPAGC